MVNGRPGAHDRAFKRQFNFNYMKYKFRGKHNLSGEWVYGNLVEGVFKDTMIQSKDESGFLSTVVVDKETVGIHFGWADTDGTDIYTGDQLELFWGNGESTRETVSYSHKYGYFMYGNNPLCELVESNIESKVIGNIHDVKPAIQDGVIINMNIDPNVKEEVKEQATEDQAAINAAEDQANDALGEPKEEVTEG